MPGRALTCELVTNILAIGSASCINVLYSGENSGVALYLEQALFHWIQSIVRHTLHYDSILMGIKRTA